MLAYRSGNLRAQRQLVWRDRTGESESVLGQPGHYGQVALSPDERRLVVEYAEAGPTAVDLWLLELSSGIFSRLTRDPAPDTDPSWSADGSQIVFSSNREGRRSGYLKDLASGKEELLIKRQGIVVDEWTKDGRFIVFRTLGRAVFALSMEGERKERLLVDTPYVEDQCRVSPDGRWIAFNSDESGKWEVYVASFPDFTHKRQVSNAGGVQPEWRTDGKELFYLSPDGKMMAVDVKSGTFLETGVPKALFQTRLSPSPFVSEYCVTKNGQRFLVVEPAGRQDAEAFHLILNWDSALK